MNLQQIEYVMAVAEERSFSKAAKKLFITQPSLSQVIAKLETQLGTQIFDRSTNPLQITQAGSIFIKYAKQIIKTDEQLRYEISELSELKKGVMNIGTNPFRASCLLAPGMTEFSRKYKGIKINLFEESPANLEKMLINGNIDLAVTHGNFDKNIFNCIPLTSEKVYLAVSENNPVNRNISDFRLFAEDIKNNSSRKNSVNPVDITMLRKEKFMLLRNDNTADEIDEKFINTFGFSPDVSVYTGHIETLFSFVLSGIGMAFIPESFIKYANVRYHPVYYSVTAPPMDVMIVSKRNRIIPKSAEEYIKILTGFFY